MCAVCVDTAIVPAVTACIFVCHLDFKAYVLVHAMFAPLGTRIQEVNHVKHSLLVPNTCLPCDVSAFPALCACGVFKLRF